MFIYVNNIHAHYIQWRLNTTYYHWWRYLYLLYFWPIRYQLSLHSTACFLTSRFLSSNGIAMAFNVCFTYGKTISREIFVEMSSIHFNAEILTFIEVSLGVVKDMKAGKRVMMCLAMISVASFKANWNKSSVDNFKTVSGKDIDSINSGTSYA